MEEGSFEIAAFYFGKKQALCVPAAARAQGRLVPCMEELSFMCTHALLRVFMLVEGIFGSGPKNIRK